MYVPLNEGIISPRTGKNTVALVGFSMSTRHLVPYHDKDTEIWGINDAYNVEGFMSRWDRWFQLHPLTYLANQDGTPRDAEHIEWLKQPHDFPIYMQKHFDDMPSSVEYPLNEVCNLIGRRYITSSFGFMFGLAWLEGFERIELYGFDMKTFTEYSSQRPNTEYMIGKAEGTGVEVFIPDLSSLCKGPLYGYEDLEISFRQEMEYHQMGLEAAVTTQTNEFHHLNGKLEAVKEILDNKPSREELKDLHVELAKATEDKVAQINNTMGREQLSREFMLLYDSLKAKELKLLENKNDHS